jgi:hypothetical protein
VPLSRLWRARDLHHAPPWRIIMLALWLRSKSSLCHSSPKSFSGSSDLFYMLLGVHVEKPEFLFFAASWVVNSGQLELWLDARTSA